MLMHCTSGQLEMAKKYLMDFKGTMSSPSSRASKRAPTWWSGEATPKPFIGQPAPEAGHKRVLGMASPYYQEGAPFEALSEGILMAPSKSIGYFFAISSCPEVRCSLSIIMNERRVQWVSRGSISTPLLPWFVWFSTFLGVTKSARSKGWSIVTVMS